MQRIFAEFFLNFKIYTLFIILTPNPTFQLSFSRFTTIEVF